MFNIKSIAIIGGGPSGLSALYEFLHVTSDGQSTFGLDSPENKAFEKVVLFEQSDKVGGVWSKSNRAADSTFPNREVLYRDNYYKADAIQPFNKLNVDLKGSSVNNRVQNPHEELPTWKSNASYPDLFTNVPERFTRFSSVSYEKKKTDSIIDPFLRPVNLQNIVEEFANSNDLSSHIRLNSQIFSAQKMKDSWRVVVRVENTEKGIDEYYEEYYDAIVVANGHHSVPYIPFIEGLSEYEIKYPGSILHSKSFRTPALFAGKKVVVVGSSISGIAITQYIAPVAKRFILSRKNKNEVHNWINKVVKSSVVDVKPQIKRMNAETKVIEFADGTKIKDIDVVIFATGYHYHYPFFGVDALSLSTSSDKLAPANNSRIRDLYYHIFKVQDPSLAFVGIVQTPQLFAAFEAQSAAIAGVWSNAKAFPTQDEQYQWQASRVAQTGDNNTFHLYSNNEFKYQYVEGLKKLVPFGRETTLDMNCYGQVDDFDRAEKTLEYLFHGLINGTVNIINDVYTSKKRSSLL